MGEILDRNRALLARIEDPDGPGPRIEALFRRGKEEQLLAGREADGSPFAPLAPSTLEHHSGSTTPLVPHGSASRVISGYRVDVVPEPGRLRVEASWPGLDWIKYHRSGTRHMPRRDPGGFRPEDVAAALRLFREWIMRDG